MEIVLFTIALVLLLSAGGGVTLLLLPRGRRVSVPELVSLAILFGCGIISLSTFIGGFLFKGWWLRSLVMFLVLVLGATAWRAHERVEIPWRLAKGWLDWAVVGLCCLQLIFITWVSLRLALSYDGLFIWDSKARLIHLSGGAMPASYFRHWPLEFNPLHPDYPLLFPLTKSWFYGWIGDTNQTLGKFVPILFYAALIGLLVSAGTRLGRSKRRGQIIAVLFPFMSWSILRVAGGEADLPLAAYFLGAVIYLLEYLETGERRLLLLSGVLGAMMPWVKQDGMILWITLVGVGFVVTSFKREWGGFLYLAVPGALVLCFWRLFLYLVEATLFAAYSPVTLGTLRHNIDRIPFIANSILKEMMNWRHWSLLWCLPLGGIVRLFDRRERGLVIAWMALIFAPLTLYGSVYLFSRYEPYTEHIELSLDRLMLHVAPIVLLGVALLFRQTAQPLLKEESSE